MTCPISSEVGRRIGIFDCFFFLTLDAFIGFASCEKRPGRSASTMYFRLPRWPKLEIMQVRHTSS